MELLCLAEGGTDAGVVAVDLHCRQERTGLTTCVLTGGSDETDGMAGDLACFIGLRANRAK